MLRMSKMDASGRTARATADRVFPGENLRSRAVRAPMNSYIFVESSLNVDILV
jgi:hypothetical protein